MKAESIFPGVALVLLCVISGIAPAQNSAAELSAAAQKECDLGRAAKARAVRLAHFQQSQTLAEQAVAVDDRLADAHFALFCGLGEQIRIDGESLSAVFGFRRMMAALDRTLELNLSIWMPFLPRRPSPPGFRSFSAGTVARGERMLRQVIQRDPKVVSARIALARLYAAQGDRQQALVLATEALQFARSERRADLLPEAQATLAELRSAHTEVWMTNP